MLSESPHSPLTTDQYVDFSEQLTSVTNQHGDSKTMSLLVPQTHLQASLEHFVLAFGAQPPT